MATDTTAATVNIRHRVPAARLPGLASVGVVTHRIIRGAVIWGVVFGAVTWVEVVQFGKEYPTLADRARAAATFGSNIGLQALFGPVHHIDTVAGYAGFHLVGVLGIIGAVWGLLAATRLLRGEEESGRWELLLAGATTRRRAAAGAVAGLGAGLLTLWTVTAAIIVAAGRTPEAGFTLGTSLFAAVAAVAPAAMFLAVGAVCSQVAATRRQAAGLAAAVFGVAYLIRVVAYSATSLRWLRWASPLGWVDELRPFTDNRPLPLIPIAATVVALAAAAIVLAGRRDLGGGVLPANDAAPARTRLLGGPFGLAVRLNLRTVLSWVGGLAAGGLILGLITKSSADAWANQSGGMMARLSATTGGAIYLGIAFLMIALLVAMAAAGQVGATREEEAEGYLDHLLARPVARLRWLAGRVAVSAVALVGFGLVAGVFAWVGAASTGAGLSLATLLAAGVNVVPVGLLVLGIGTLVHGLAPRVRHHRRVRPGRVVVPRRDHRGRPRRQPLAAGHLDPAPHRPGTRRRRALGQRRDPYRHRRPHRRGRGGGVRPPRPQRRVNHRTGSTIAHTGAPGAAAGQAVHRVAFRYRRVAQPVAVLAAGARALAVRTPAPPAVS